MITLLSCSGQASILIVWNGIVDTVNLRARECASISHEAVCGWTCRNGCNRPFGLPMIFSLMLPLKRFNIVRKSSETVEISIVGAGRWKDSTECTFEFLSSILNGYGYTIINHDLNVGHL